MSHCRRRTDILPSYLQMLKKFRTLSIFAYLQMWLTMNEQSSLYENDDLKSSNENYHEKCFVSCVIFFIDPQILLWE